MGWQDTERGQTGMATVMYEVGVWSVFNEGVDGNSVFKGHQLGFDI